MKKSLSFITLIVLVCLLFSLIGCTFKDYASEDGDDLFKKATLTNSNGSAIKASTKQAAGEVINIKLPKAITLNTIVLGESKSIITGFEFSYKDMENGEMKKFYAQDLVEDYRYCTFKALTTDTIQLKVTSTLDNKKWNLNKLCAYNISQTNKSDFNVFAYSVLGYAYDGVDPVLFDTVTHVDIFRNINFDFEGNLVYWGIERDGEKLDGKMVFERELANYRKAIGNRNTKIIVTLINDSGDVNDAHNSVFTTHKEKFIKNILALIEEYQLDGIGFDYEYCNTMSDYKNYGDFIKELKQAMPKDKILSVALCNWQFKPGLFPKNAIPYIDMIQLMTYDMFEGTNYHSTFQVSVMDALSEFAFCAGKKYLNKVNLGLPFYARPTSEWRGDWIDYKSWVENQERFNFASTADYFSNKVDCNYEIEPGNPKSQCDGLYFNSPQMIYDKTSFAIDNNLGGVMFWHMACDLPLDHPLSLIKAINSSINDRK